MPGKERGAVRVIVAEDARDEGRDARNTSRGLATPGTGSCEHDLRVDFAIGIEKAVRLAIALAIIPFLELLVVAPPEADLPHVLAQNILERRARETLEDNIRSLFANVSAPENAGECECFLSA